VGTTDKAVGLQQFSAPRLDRTLYTKNSFSAQTVFTHITEDVSFIAVEIKGMGWTTASGGSLYCLI
jgi:hypothetical protein